MNCLVIFTPDQLSEAYAHLTREMDVQIITSITTVCIDYLLN